MKNTNSIVLCEANSIIESINEFKNRYAGYKILEITGNSKHLWITSQCGLITKTFIMENGEFK